MLAGYVMEKETITAPGDSNNNAGSGAIVHSFRRKTAFVSDSLAS